MNENSLVICFGGPTVNKTALCRVVLSHPVQRPLVWRKAAHQPALFQHVTYTPVTLYSAICPCLSVCLSVSIRPLPRSAKCSWRLFVTKLYLLLVGSCLSVQQRWNGPPSCHSHSQLHKSLTIIRTTSTPSYSRPYVSTNSWPRWQAGPLP